MAGEPSPNPNQGAQVGAQHSPPPKTVSVDQNKNLGSLVDLYYTYQNKNKLQKRI